MTGNEMIALANLSVFGVAIVAFFIWLHWPVNWSKQEPLSDVSVSESLDAFAAKREREAAALEAKRLEEAKRLDLESAALEAKRRDELAAIEARLRSESEEAEERRRLEALASADRIAMLQAFRARKPTIKPEYAFAFKDEPLRDRVWLPAHQPLCVRFFQIPVGQSDPNYSGNYYIKTSSDTTMQIHGRLCDPEEFEAIGVALVPDEGSHKDDLRRLRDAVVEIRHAGYMLLWRRFTGAEILAHDPTAPRVLCSDSMHIRRNENLSAEITSRTTLAYPMHASLYLFGFHAVPGPRA